MTASKQKKKAAATLIIGTCLLATLLFDGPTEQQVSLRRSLQQDVGESSVPVDDSQGIYPWAKENLYPLNAIPEPQKDYFMFWHIPKSGGTTSKAIFRCLRTDIWERPSQINASKMKNIVSNSWQSRHTPGGIPKVVDVIFTSSPGEHVEQLFSPVNKGRILGMFRNPVDRLISKFYYLQVAGWEKTYHPEWKDIDILEWVKTINIDNNHMVKKLAGKALSDEANEVDLVRAKRTIKETFIVGLMTEMEESFRRFHIVMNINANTDERYLACQQAYFGGSGRKSNSNKHPSIKEDHPAYQLLVEQNSLDLELFNYILEQFVEQKELLETYKSSIPDVSRMRLALSTKVDTRAGFGKGHVRVSGLERLMKLHASTNKSY